MWILPDLQTTLAIWQSYCNCLPFLTSVICYHNIKVFNKDVDLTENNVSCKDLNSKIIINTTNIVNFIKVFTLLGKGYHIAIQIPLRVSSLYSINFKLLFLDVIYQYSYQIE